MSKENVDLMVTNGTIVTCDNENRVYRNGTIVSNRGRIVFVGKAEEASQLYDSENSLDASNSIICPGLIDTHVHLAQALLRGAAEDIDRTHWLRDRMWPLTGLYSEKQGKASAALCILEMIKSGTTCFLEVQLRSTDGFEDVAEFAKNSGIRSVLSRAIIDTPNNQGSNKASLGKFEDKEQSIKETLSSIRKWKKSGDGRVGVWFGPRPIGYCRTETFAELSQLAKENEVGITIHHSEAQEEVDLCQREYNMLPTELMQKVGIVGKRVVFAHCICVNSSEIAIMAQTGTSCSDVPSSNAKLGMGIAPVVEMVRAGVNVSIGCNGGANNNTYDMFRETSRSLALQRAITRDPHCLSNAEALKMATINGAKALGMAAEIGSLEVGKKADLVIVDCNKPHLKPMFDPIATLIHGVSGQDVDTVIVDGNILMRHREVKTIEEQTIINNAEAAFAELTEKSGMIPM